MAMDGGNGSPGAIADNIQVCRGVANIALLKTEEFAPVKYL